MLMGQRWMPNVMLAADKMPDLSGFDDDDAEVPEIITLKPGEEIPQDDDDDDDDKERDSGKVTLSKEEFESLKQGQNSSGALLEGIKGLKDAIAPANQAPQVAQKPGENDEDFEKRLERELFAEGKSAKAIKEAINRYGGSQVAELMGIISQQNKQLIELHPEKNKVYSRYKDEVEHFVKSLPAHQQNHPQVWDYAVTQVKAKHQDELTQESVNEMVERKLAERLKELGLDNGGNEEPKIKKSSGYMEHSSSGSANIGTTPKRRKIFVTAQDERNAAESGMPIEHYLRKVGKIN